MSEIFEIENGVLTKYSGGSHSIVIPKGVGVIGKEVFKGMAWITDVSLPDGLTEICDNAFKGCRKLENINFPDSLEKIGDFAFHRCHSLVSVTLPDSVKFIGKGAFLYCDSLKNFRAFGVRHIEKQTFANNTQLEKIALDSGVDCSDFGNDTFTGCLSIKEIELSDGTFYRAENLLSVLLTDKPVHPVIRAVAESVYQSVKIENGVLYKLNVNLKSFELPEGIRIIEKSCFFNKKGIVSVTFPKSLERIKSNAFGNCINLEKIILQSENIVVEEGAFRGCSSLKNIIIGGQAYRLGGIAVEENTPYIVRKTGFQVMSDFYISGRILVSYTGCEERVTVPDGVEIIGEGCFEGNEKIGRVIMPDTVREIHENAFRNCVCMQTVVMSENLQIIRRSAFENCKKLIRFNIPATLKEVGFSAFRGCRSLELTEFETVTPPAVRIKEHVYSENDVPAYSHCNDDTMKELVFDTPLTIGKYAFSGCRNLKTVVINNPDCKIERNAFEKCPSLREIKVLAGEVEKGAFSFCRELEKAEIGGVSALPDELFAGCCSLKKIKFSREVAEIGGRCFDDCTSLAEIDLSQIKFIGERAFERCDGLTEIKLQKTFLDFHAFADCSALKKIILDSGTTFQSGAFFGCTFAEKIILDGAEYSFSCFSQSKNTAENLLPLRVQEIIGSVYSCFYVDEKNGIKKYRGDAVRVRIPDDIVSAGDEAFRDRLRTTDIVFPACFGQSGKLTFSGTGWLEKKRGELGTKFNIVNGLLIDGVQCGEIAVLTDDIKRVCSWAFAGNVSLRELVLKNSRIAIDTFAFRNCINLKKITCPDGRVYTLVKYNDITEKDYPELVRRIFSECINCFKTDENGILSESTGNIKNLVFPEGIIKIGDEVYMDCNLLESITLSADTAVIGKSAFQSSKWLKTVKNAVGVRSIGVQAFSGCKSLESIDISDKLENLGKRAFEHCCGLREIHISKKLTVIPEMAFFRCKSLKKIFIPESVRKIESKAFAFCSELEEVVFQNRDGVEIADDAFAWCDKL